jgi:NADH-quinone oxidoreductase subunit M
MHTREIARMGGLWQTVPALSGAAFFFIMASVGLPGLGDFVGEFLVLLGTFQTHAVVATLATVGIIVATLYGLRLTAKVFQGPNSRDWVLPDLFPREWVVAVCMMAGLLWLGLYPQSFIDMFKAVVQQPVQAASSVDLARR